MQRHMPIGYKLVNGKVVLETKKVKTVQKIFKDYLNGASMIAIAKELTATGFPNANNKTSWNHGSVGRVLENIKYLGDDMYPQVINKKEFELVQSRRKSVGKRLGRSLQHNSMKSQSLFSQKLKCGECNESYRKYTEHVGKPSEKSNWKCKNYIYKNKVHCRNLFLTEEEIEGIFISATNKILSKMWLLDKKHKKEVPRMTIEIRKIEEQIKELEEEEQFSSKELSELIIKRATAYYNNSKIGDYDYNTKKMKEELAGKEPLMEFNEDLFIKIIKQITIFKDGRIVLEYINGITMEEKYEEKRKE